VQVAKLAGLPEPVIERAKAVLELLEQGEREGGGKARTLIDDLPLFSVRAVQAAAPSGPSEVEERLREIRPDEMSPRDALAALYELRSLLAREGA
jgi:DNA mismatch repair protein MutS